MPGMPVAREVQVTLQKTALLLLEHGRGAEFLKGLLALRRDVAHLEGSGAAATTVVLEPLEALPRIQA